MKQLMSVMKKFKKLLLPLLAASFLCALASLGKTLYAIRIADFWDAVLGTAAAKNTFSLRLLFSILLLLAAYLGLMIVSERMFGKVILKGTRMLQEENASVLLDMKVDEKMASGEILDRINRDSTDLKTAVSNLLRGSLVTGLTSLVMLIVLSFICWEMALIAFLLPVLYNLCVLRFSEGHQPQQSVERQKMSRLTDFLEDRLVNREEIRLACMENTMSAQHQALLGQWDHTKKKLSRFWSSVGACDTLLYLGYRLVLVLTGVAFVNRGTMSLGDIFTFLVLSGTFMNFVWDFQIEAYRNAVAAAGKILDYWKLPRERTDGKEQPWIEKATPIHAQQLSFSYKDDVCLFRDISFCVHAGEIFGIVGESGCGKSTLLNILCGFLDPISGEARVGGFLSSDWKLDAMRSHLGYMQQKTTLIKGSIYENVALRAEADLSQAEKDEIEHILEQVGLDTLACGPSEKQDLSMLSQGELQRVGFARCLFKKATIWLLDEPTSALDSENEQAIIQLMKNFNRQGIAQVVVTHRPAVSEMLDRSIHLNPR